jgi:hypothetical protein
MSLGSGRTAFAQVGKIGPAPDTLSVLYAGPPASDPMEEFGSFLKANFKKVATCDFENFVRSDADGFDVVIFDWPYPRMSGVNDLSMRVS